MSPNGQHRSGLILYTVRAFEENTTRVSKLALMERGGGKISLAVSQTPSVIGDGGEGVNGNQKHDARREGGTFSIGSGEVLPP